LPAVGRALRAGEAAAVVESVKAAGDIYAPLAGAVAAVNTALAATPELINRSPYDDGWLFRLARVDAAGLAGLLSAEQYRALLAKG
jgi:glycine cleavage system H protein